MGEVTVRSLTPCFRLAAVAAACAACATAGTSNAPPVGADGVGLCPGSVVDSIQAADVAVTDSTSGWVVRALPIGSAPRYPERAKSASVEADVVASFIVDTTGRVVPRSGAIERAAAWSSDERRGGALPPTIGTLPARDFALAVCQHLPRLHFEPVRATVPRSDFGRSSKVRPGASGRPA